MHESIKVTTLMDFKPPMPAMEAIMSRECIV